MRYTRVPNNLLLLVLLAPTFPVLAMVQKALALNIPYWKIELGVSYPSVAIVGAGSLLLVFLLLRGGRVTRLFYVLGATAWFAHALFHALQGNNAFYGLSILILLLWLAFYGWLLFQAYQATYIDSGQRWFEGSPREIPGISATIQSQNGSLGPYRVSRISEEGVYLVGPAPGATGKKLPLRLRLEFLEHRLEADGVLVRARTMNNDADSCGIGMQFKNPDRDLQKEIADLVESLRGAGYVS